MPGARQAFRFNLPSKPDDGFRIMSRLLALVVAACLAAPLMASAQLASSDAAIKHRQAAFTLMATYFARINSVVKGERLFNRPSVAADAQLVEPSAGCPGLASHRAATVARPRPSPTSGSKKKSSSALEMTCKPMCRPCVSPRRTVICPRSSSRSNKRVTAARPATRLSEAIDDAAALHFRSSDRPGHDVAAAL